MALKAEVLCKQICHSKMCFGKEFSKALEAYRYS
jgi:hypothetical protein